MNNLKQILLTQLRDTGSSRSQFRAAADQLGRLLVQEVAEHLSVSKTTVTTPTGTAEGTTLTTEPVLVPILRSGLILLPAFQFHFPGAGIGFVGLRRDEETAVPKLYYSNMPTINPDTPVIVLDPMVATGGSAVAALKVLTESGVNQKQIIFAGVIGAPEGVENITSNFPEISFLITQIDEGLNDKKFIVPGLGDFGDRYFGTEG